MLKSVLGDRIKEKIDYEEENIGNEEVESGNDEILFQYSDSIMECGSKKRRLGIYFREVTMRIFQGIIQVFSFVYSDWFFRFQYFKIYKRIKNSNKYLYFYYLEVIDVKLYLFYIFWV